MYKKIIVFEGIDGSGKTFHLNEVSKYLNKKKVRFVKFREPGGTINSEIIRNIILTKKSTFKKKNRPFTLFSCQKWKLWKLD